jgi:tryptophan synthase alpha chain
MSETVASPASTSRISEAFARANAEGRIALLPFVTIGYPTLAQSREVIKALVAAGADGLELGVPFSDPLADGATVQRTSQIALENGVTLRDALDMVRTLRTEDGIEVPLVLMGYTNPFYQFGLEALAAEAQAVGIDGFIVPDLPVEEADEWTDALRAAGRDLIFMVAPTSTEKRLEGVAERASGFIYCVSLVGVTGAREQLADDLATYIGRVRAKIDLPLVIGFGISTPAHVAEVAGLVDGAIVASALINYLDTLPLDEQVNGAISFTQALKAATGKPES